MATVRASRRKHHIIYKTTCLVTGRYYVGMHSTDDLNDKYLGSGLRLQRSIKKYGADQHTREILEDLATREAASEREKELITEEMRADPECLNCGAGGLGAVDRPPTKEETRQKLSAASKAVVRTPEWCAKIAASHLGKIPDPEIGKRHSEKMKGRTSTPEQIAARTAGQLSSEKFKQRYRTLIVDGITYQNGREATTALGIPSSTLFYRLNSPNWSTYSYA
jgi:hypothetical protein